MESSPLGLVENQETFHQEKDIRVYAAECLRKSSLLLLASALVLSTFTFRWYLITRPPPTIYQDFSGLIIYVSDILLVMAIVLWVLAHYLNNKSVRRGLWYITGPAMLLVLMSLLSPIWAVRPELALETGIRLLLLFCIYIIAINEVELSPLVVPILMIGLVLQASSALGQFINQGSLGLASLGEPLFGGSGPVYRVYGLTNNPNFLGGFLSFILPLVFAFYLKYGSSKILSIAYLIVGAMGTAGLYVSGSRGAWIGCALALALILPLVFVSRPQIFPLRRVLLAMFAIALVSAFFVVMIPEIITSRFNTKSQITSKDDIVSNLGQLLGGRDIQVHQFTYLIKGRHLTGVGAGNYVLALDLIAPPGNRWATPIHNVPLLVIGELGILAGICWLIFVTSPFIYMASNRRQVGRTALFLGWFGAFVVIVAVSFVDYYPWGAQQGRIFFWTILGFWSGYAVQLDEGFRM